MKRNKVVSAIHLLPGLLEGSVSVSTIHLAEIKNSPNILDEHKKLIEIEENFTATKWITMELNLTKQMDSFIEICKIKKKLMLEG